jgi:nucleoside-diphosphate-sugar epimerase
MFESWARETGARAAIARIFNLSGPYINKPDRYALASFIVDALAERPIEIRAPRRVVRGYVAVEDLVALAFSILLDGGRGALLFETGGEPVDLEAVAHLVSEQLGNVPVPMSDRTPTSATIRPGVTCWSTMGSARQRSRSKFDRQLRSYRGSWREVTETKGVVCPRGPC